MHPEAKVAIIEDTKYTEAHRASTGSVAEEENLKNEHDDGKESAFAFRVNATDALFFAVV